MTRLIPAFVCLLLFSAALPAHAQTSLEIPPPQVAARAFLLVDVLSNKVLAAQSASARFEPASLTKIMTAYLTFTALKEKKLALAQTLPVSEQAWKSEGSRMFIEPRTPVTVDDLIHGMIIQSGNDATIALAEGMAGSENAFVERMNREAQRLGMQNTHFTNATGLPDAQHYSTAEDLAKLAGALIGDFPEEYKIYSQKEFTYNKIKQANRNRLLWLDPFVDGMKTGHTEAAGYCLIASARRGEGEKARRLISIVLGASSDAARAQENQKLLNYGFQYYDTRRLYRKGEIITTPEIFKGSSNTVKLGFDKDLWLSLPKDSFAGIKATLTTTQPLLAPLAAGQKAGIMKLSRGSTAIAEFPVVALEDVPVAGFLGRGWDAIRLLFR
jgi:D-alanyl-D-alanine carboxypeptidase (penicillin-binding protein 5/6)